MAVTPFSDDLQKLGLAQAAEPAAGQAPAPARSFSADMQAQGLLPKPPAPAPPVDPNQSTSVAGDMGRELGVGLNQLASLAGVGLRKAGLETAGTALKKVADDRIEELTSQLSPEQTAARETAFLDPDLTVAQGFRKVGGAAAASAPAMALGGGFGAGITRSLMLKGVGSTVAGVAGGAIGEGSVGAGLNYLDVYDQASSLPTENLAKTSEYQDALASLTEGTPEEREALAREKTASALALQSAGAVGLMTAVLGAPSGVALAKILGGETGKTALRTILKQAGLEAAQEGPQSAAETLITGEVLAKADTTKRATADDVLEATLAGILTGGTLGGAIGGASQVLGERDLAKRLGTNRPMLKQRINEIIQFKATNPDAEISNEQVQQYLAGAVTLGGQPLEEAVAAAPVASPVEAAVAPMTDAEAVDALGLDPAPIQGEVADDLSAVQSPGSEVRQEVQGLRSAGAEVAPAADRRVDLSRRERLAQMTPEQVEAEIYRSPLTGLQNKRAFAENPRLPHVASLDLDGLKWVNDNLGHQYGDELIKAMGEAVAELTPEGYHFSGDEFVMQGESPEALQQTIDTLRDQLSYAVLEYTAPDGTVTRKQGVEFGYGIGSDIATAEEALKAAKAASPTRRGAEPEGVVRIPAAGRQAQGDLAREEVAPALAEPAAATPVAPADRISELTTIIANETGKPVAEGTFTAAAAPDPVYESIAKIIGKEIVFFKAKDSPVAFDGVTRKNGVLYVNKDSSRPHLAVVGHEFLHELEVSAPKEYQALLEAVRAVMPESERQAAWVKQNEKRVREGRKPISMAKVDDEVVADFFGSQFTKRSFWEKVEAQNPEGFAAVVQKFIDFIEKVKEVFAGPRLRDMQRAQDAAVEILAAHQKTQASRGGETSFAEGETNVPTPGAIAGLPVEDRLRVLHGLDQRQEPAERMFTAAVPGVSANGTLARRLDAIAGGFGHSVTLVAGRGSGNADGFISDTDRKHVYIFEDSVDPHLVVLGHELTHQMSKTRPELYEEFVTELSALADLPELQQYFLKRRPKDIVTGADGTASVSPRVVEEWVAEVVGRNFASGTFWNDFAAVRPNLAGRLAAFVNDLVQKAKDTWFAAKHTERTLKDLRAVEKLTADVMAKYAPEEASFAEADGNKPFYSKLEEVVQAKVGGKIPATALKNMLKNNGVSDDEIATVLPGLDTKAVYTRAEVLDEIRANAVEFEDAVLGDPSDTIQSQWRLVYDDGTAFGTAFATREEAQAEAANVFYGRTDITVRERPTGDSTGAGRPLATPPQFSQYVEPGAVEGSYREMFVTAPKALREGVTPTGWNVVRSADGRLLGEYQSEAEARQAVGEGQEIVPVRNDSAVDAIREGGWQDGHSQYSDVKNPVVRIRFNERQVGGQRVLFVEEIQGPSDANQEKMPEYLRKRIYDIGVKRVLAYAQENGFDGVAWTTGEQQASRYDLSKQVESIGYQKRGDAYNVTVWDKDGKQVWQNQSASKEDVAETIGKEMLQKMEDGVGRKEGGIAYLEDLDLKVGGEGLKSLYDRMLPSLFKKYGKEKVGELQVPNGTMRQSFGLPSSADFEANALPGEDIGAYAKRMAATPKTVTQPFIPLTARTPASYASFAEASESLSREAKKNLKTMVQGLKAGSFKLKVLPDIFKVTPEPVMVEVYKDRIPQLANLYSLRRQRDAMRNEIIDNAAIDYQRIVDLAKKGVGVAAVENTAALASFYQMNPHMGLLEQDWVDSKGTAEARLKGAQSAWEKAGMDAATGLSFREAYRASAKAFAGLKSKDLQDAYLEAAKSMKELRLREKNNVQRIIEQATAGNPELRADLLNKLEASFAGLKGTYWPLYREGDFRLEYMDGAVRVVEHFESDFERQQVKAALVEGGVDAETFRETYKDKTPPALAAIPGQLMGQLTSSVEKTFLAGVDPNDIDATAAAKERAAETIRDMTEIWLRWQPETSALKNSIQRRNVQGFSLKMLRGYLRYSQTHGSRIAQLEEGRKIEDLLTEIGNDLKGRKGDTTVEGMVLNDMREREAAGKTIHVNKFAANVGKLTTLWYMTSPSIALVQMTQLGVLTLPKLSVMFSPPAAAKAMTQGLNMAFSQKYTRKAMFDDAEVNLAYDDMTATVTPQNRRGDQTLGDLLYSPEQILKKIEALTPEQQRLLALRVAMGRNLLDISLSHEVGEIVRGGDPSKPASKTFKAMMSFMRVSETASRKTAILGTFEAAKASGKNFFEAIEAVDEVVESTLYNYSKDAKGVLLQGSTARILLTFQHFRIMTAFKLGLLARNSFHGNKPAMKEFIGIMGMSALLAGTMGMPFVSLLMRVLSAALGDDDEPYDAEAEFSKFLGESLGTKGAQAVMEGPASFFGAAISSRIGVDVFGGQEMPVRLHGSAAASWWATQLLGPSYSMVDGWARGCDQMVNDGDYMKGLESVSPKPLKDMLKAYGLATDGLKTGQGKRLMAAENIGTNELLMMALGFQPAEVSRIRTDRRRLDNLGTIISQRRGQLVQRFVKDYFDGDSADAMEAITEYNRRQPTFAIGGSDLRTGLRAFMRGDLGVATRREALLSQKLGK